MTIERHVLNNMILQTVRELTTKVEKLEEADAKRTTESAENETKPAMIMEPQLMLTAGKPIQTLCHLQRF